MSVKSFRNWTEQELQKVFNLARIPDGDTLLEDWMAADIAPTEEEQKGLLKLKQQIRLNADYWNEEERKMKFVSKMLELVDVDNHRYRAFYNRNLSAKVYVRRGGYVHCNWFSSTRATLFLFSRI